MVVLGGDRDEEGLNGMGTEGSGPGPDQILDQDQDLGWQDRDQDLGWRDLQI